jgi:hypothetical protein
MSSSRRRSLTSSGTSSGSLRAAAVLPRSLYANRYAVSYPTYARFGVDTEPVSAQCEGAETGLTRERIFNCPAEADARFQPIWRQVATPAACTGE